MTLGIVYHMPFWQAADGSLWEAEGSFGRYVDSLAPYFDEIVLSVPVFDTPQLAGSRLRSTNVRLAPLPYFPGPRQFYPMLPAARRRLRAFVRDCDVIHLRVPTPAAIFAFRLARAARKPVFLLVVGDYEALLPHLPYRGLKKFLFRAYVAFEEWALRHMTTRALTFANGAALREKHERQGATVFETKTTTLAIADLASRTDTCAGSEVRCLTVSRIDPRKGLRALPGAIAGLARQGRDVAIDIVGPTIGQIGDAERDAIAADARQLGVAERVRLRGAIPLDQLMPMYQQYDIFVLPTQPGEGIPRVLLEAMAAGLPVVTTDVSGIRSLVRHGENGLLIGESSPGALAAAIEQIVTEAPLRRRLIEGGYRTARAHTLERQASSMMTTVSERLGLSLNPVAQPA
jgi:glycosyltransferase involved in cell wall biosynthesis